MRVDWFHRRPAAALVALAAVLGLGSSAFAQSPGPTPLGAERARLFLTRTGFPPAESEVVKWAPLSQGQAVDLVLAQTRTNAVARAPAWIDEPVVLPRDLKAMSEDARKQERQKQIRHGIELRGWWLQEMVSTPSPLTERMTLFWHNHFVSAQPKVRYAQLMYRQNVLLRSQAVGNFGTLLHAIARDPAMLIYLDMATNRRAAPNENFAREVMELFTLGEGNYSESDVKESARAFSGWSFDPDRTTFLFRPRLHDGGEKTVLGRKGAWQGDDVLDILLQQPATAEFVVRKLWLEFVSPRPDTQRVRVIAQRFRGSGYDIRAVLRELFLQPEIVQRDQDNALVKSPAELTVGLIRQAGGELVHPAALAVQIASMGQNLFSAPNVRGWPGGEAWITTQTLLARKQFLEAMIIRSRQSNAADPVLAMSKGASPSPQDSQADPPLARMARALGQIPATQVDLGGWLKSAGVFPERAVGMEGAASLSKNLLVLAPASPVAAESLGVDALRAVLLDPVYQLK